MWRYAVKFIGTYLLSHLKFIVSNFFVDKECTENWWNSYTIKLVLQTWFSERTSGDHSASIWSNTTAQPCEPVASQEFQLHSPLGSRTDLIFTFFHYVQKCSQ